MKKMQDSGEIYDFGVLRDLRHREDLNIDAVSRVSGVSPAVISRLERNLTIPELDTVYRLARVFGMTASELLALAENRSAQHKHASQHRSDGFVFSEIRYGNIRCLHGSAVAGSRVSRPKIHKDDYELCWVLAGKLAFHLPHEDYVMEAGDAIQFDALLEHTYEAVEDCRILIIHIRKEKRF